MTQPIPDPAGAAAHAELCRDVVADLLEAQDYLVTIGLTVAGLTASGRTPTAKRSRRHAASYAPPPSA